MRCPPLTELPPPTAGKTGWPWTEETPRALGGSGKPRISIVTPSFNQGPYLEETIRSVLLQGYPDLEYMIIDGGSTDDSISIIRKYEKWFTYWVSGKDDGQAHAINKGLARATGAISAYLNSDDVFLPGALQSVAVAFEFDPQLAVLYGDCEIIEENSSTIDTLNAPEFNLRELLFRCYILQPGTFWKTSAVAKVGNFNPAMHFAFDYDLWLRLAADKERFQHMPTLLARHRKTEGTKSVSQPERFGSENIIALERFFGLAAAESNVKSQEQDAYALAYLNTAFLNFRLGRLSEARGALANAFHQSPKLATTQRARVIRALIDHTDVSTQLSEARAYLEAVFADLPEIAAGLSELRETAWRRIQILHGSRSGDRQHLQQARKLLFATVLLDPDWVRNKAVRRELLKVLLGGSAIRRIAALKNLFATNVHAKALKHYS